MDERTFVFFFAFGVLCLKYTCYFIDFAIYAHAYTDLDWPQSLMSFFVVKLIYSLR